MRKALPLLFLLLFSAFALAQVTYNAPTGSIASTFVTSMNLQLGGSATVYPNLGSCYYPGPCGSTNASFNYSLPDGSTANFYPVSSHFVYAGTVACGVVNGVVKTCPAYTVTIDQATTVDSHGRSVTASVTFHMHTVGCVQPRGTCPPKKVYDNGSLTVQ
jgi:hypothetical protein